VQSECDALDEAGMVEVWKEAAAVPVPVRAGRPRFRVGWWGWVHLRGVRAGRPRSQGVRAGRPRSQVGRPGRPRSQVVRERLCFARQRPAAGAPPAPLSTAASIADLGVLLLELRECFGDALPARLHAARTRCNAAVQWVSGRQRRALELHGSGAGSPACGTVATLRAELRGPRNAAKVRGGDLLAARQP
jgi:hypothetical protein